MNDTRRFSHRTRFTLALPLIACLFVACLSADDANTSNAPTATNSATPAASPQRAANNVHGAPDANAIRVEASPVRLAPGARGEAFVRLTIAPPLHVNANPASQSFLIPTQLTVPSGATGEGITIGAPIYPEAVTRKFSFDDEPLRVYEGTVEIRVPVNVARNAATGERQIVARVRVQPCDDAACYPPRTIETNIPVIVGQ